MPPAVPPASPASFDLRQAMPIEKFLTTPGKVDDFLEGLFPGASDDEIEASKEELKAMHATCARVFGSADGRKVLEWLCDMTLRQPVFIVARDLDPGVGYALAAKREGANEIVWKIITAMALGRSQKPPRDR